MARDGPVMGSPPSAIASNTIGNYKESQQKGIGQRSKRRSARDVAELDVLSEGPSARGRPRRSVPMRSYAEDADSDAPRTKRHRRNIDHVVDQGIEPHSSRRRRGSIRGDEQGDVLRIDDEEDRGSKEYITPRYPHRNRRLVERLTYEEESDGSIRIEDLDNEEDDGDEDDEDDAMFEEYNRSNERYSLRNGLRRVPTTVSSLHSLQRSKRKVIAFSEPEQRALRRSSRTRNLVQRFEPEIDQNFHHHHHHDVDAAAAAGGKKSQRGSSRRKRRSRRRHLSEFDDLNPGDGWMYVDQSSSESSSSSYDSRRHADLERNKMRPLDVGGFELPSRRGHRRKQGGELRNETALADIDPMAIDQSVDWSLVGGLERHVQSLKEMVMLPLLYPEVFARFKITPPRGVLFHGPPGTGKTLVARALANACSLRTGRKVAFFMRKGADCLSKWVGETERQLRLLFEAAYLQRPSVIFFDELDGLAPVRSSRQDQIHSSIVSTLLALMDGLDDRGNVVVIGATNRIDAIDPALRRPGRFDRELNFSLPSKPARRAILKIHAKAQQQAATGTFIDDEFLDSIADRSIGYCGADLKALCTEAALRAVRRTYPQIYGAPHKLRIDVSTIAVRREDYAAALLSITPASHRCSMTVARPLPSHLNPLLEQQLMRACKVQQRMFPLDAKTSSMISVADESDIGFTSNQPLRPRLLLHGDAGSGQSWLLYALLHSLEEFPVYTIDLPALLGDPVSKSAEESCVRAVNEARRNAPSILLWPHVDVWWNTAPPALRSTAAILLQDIAFNTSVFLLASSEQTVDRLLEGVDDGEELIALFNKSVCAQIHLEHPDEFCRRAFLAAAIAPARERPISGVDAQPATLDELEPASPQTHNTESKVDCPPESVAKQSEIDPVPNADEFLVSLRLVIRGVCSRLMSQFKSFAHPVDRAKEPQYYALISDPLCIDDMRHRNNCGEYMCVADFLQDVELLVANVRTYYTDRTPLGRSQINRACQLQDSILARVFALDSELVEACDKIAKHRRALSEGIDKRDNSERDQRSTSLIDAQADPPTGVLLTDDMRVPLSILPEDVSYDRGDSVLASQEDALDNNAIMDVNIDAEHQIDVAEIDASLGQAYELVDNLLDAEPKNCATLDAEMRLDGERKIREDVAFAEQVNHRAHDEPNVQSGSESDDKIELQVTEIGQLSDDPKLFVLDEARLHSWIHRAVLYTEGHHVDELEMFHFKISRVIHAYAHVWDRSSLPDELDALLNI